MPNAKLILSKTATVAKKYAFPVLTLAACGVVAGVLVYNKGYNDGYAVPEESKKALETFLNTL